MGLTTTLARMPLARQIFLVAALVLGGVTAALVLSPVTISSPMTGRDTALVLGGLLLVLATIHLALRRLLAPLHRLADAMGTIDPRDPDPGLRARIAPDDRDVERLLEAFEQMLDRFRLERLDSDRRTSAAQEHERRTIAGEVHDELGQTLTALSLQLDRATMDPQHRELAQRTVARALGDVRDIARRLRPEGLDDLGLVNAVIALCVRVQEESGLTIDRDLSAPLPPLDGDVELALYRIAQEALTNAIRHADAGRATVALRAEDGHVVLTVTDDGRGFVAAPPADGGIAGMRERARLIRGSFDLRAETRLGTRMRCAVPVPSR
ncbi:sensor histidine kinase [Patulibacter sp. NPDC049589]|uniref:sensor histidine kinase n=1 Tax=Patulibacter sp. NPDC049589 TaxID=3154731 RepID=UPI0034291C9B